MPDLFTSEALKQGYITLEHSLSQSKGELELSKAKYLLINPHDSANLDFFPKEIFQHLPHNQKLLQDYLELERDPGLRELCNLMVKNIPGGIAVHVNVARGIIDLNRISKYALSPIAKVIPEPHRSALLKIHQLILEFIDELIAQLPAQIQILCLHSMRTNVIPKVPPISSDPNMIKAFVDFFEQSVGQSNEAAIDLITGPADRPDLANLQLKNNVAKLLDQAGLAWVENFPYKTERNRHKTTDYMQLRPGQVLGIDFPKHYLCLGSAKPGVEEGKFSHLSPQIDQKKIEKMASILQKALIQTP